MKNFICAVCFAISICSTNAFAATTPSPPTNLKATSVTATSVTIAWTASTGVNITYRAYRNGTQIESNAGNTYYTDSGLTASAKYTYTVKAQNSSGKLSAASTALSVTTLPAPVNGVCGTSNGVESLKAPTTNLCGKGKASAVTESGTTLWNWTCSGSNGGGSANCSAPVQPPIVNGACGSANGTAIASTPSINLCSSGSATTVSGTDPWSWQCDGSSGGTTVSCSALLLVNGTCGSANGTTTPSAPASNLCSAGTATSVSGSGPWSWSCSGSNGGSTASCSATPGCSATSAIIGVNVNGPEYSWESYPTITEINYLKNKGVTFIRLPTSWEKIQPILNGPLSQTEITNMKAFLALAASNGIQVIIDIHNNGRYDPTFWQQVNAGNAADPGPTTAPAIGTTDVPISAFVDLWTKLASTLKGQAGLAGYDIMNEPNYMPKDPKTNLSIWPQAAQAAITAIRSVDTATTIVVEGDAYANAQNWVTYNPGFPLHDPVNNIVYEAHSYWDDGSSNYAQPYSTYCPTACPNRGVTLVQPFIQWLQQNKLRGYVGEFAVPGNDANWNTVLNNAVAYITQNGVSATYWSYNYDEPQGKNTWWVTQNAGGSSIFIDPQSNGSDATQWATLKPYISSGIQASCWNYQCHASCGNG